MKKLVAAAKNLNEVLQPKPKLKVVGIKQGDLEKLVKKASKLLVEEDVEELTEETIEVLKGLKVWAFADSEKAEEEAEEEDEDEEEEDEEEDEDVEEEEDDEDVEEEEDDEEDEEEEDEEDEDEDDEDEDEDEEEEEDEEPTVLEMIEGASNLSQLKDLLKAEDEFKPYRKEFSKIKKLKELQKAMIGALTKAEKAKAKESAKTEKKAKAKAEKKPSRKSRMACVIEVTTGLNGKSIAKKDLIQKIEDKYLETNEKGNLDLSGFYVRDLLSTLEMVGAVTVTDKKITFKW